MAVAASMTMRSHAAKKNAAIGAIAMSIGRQRNDVLYHKAKKYRALWRDCVDQLKSKYASQATTKWALNQAKG